MQKDIVVGITSDALSDSLTYGLHHTLTNALSDSLAALDQLQPSKGPPSFLETHAAYAEPLEGGKMLVTCGHQFPLLTPRGGARSAGRPVPRLAIPAASRAARARPPAPHARAMLPRHRPRAAVGAAAWPHRGAAACRR